MSPYSLPAAVAASTELAASSSTLVELDDEQQTATGPRLNAVTLPLYCGQSLISACAAARRDAQIIIIIIIIIIINRFL